MIEAVLWLWPASIEKEEKSMSNATLPVGVEGRATSYEAADKAAIGASMVRLAVLEPAPAHGPLTRHELISRHHRLPVVEPDPPKASGAVIRTRPRKLRHLGLIGNQPRKGQPGFDDSAEH
ncbi:hypothetical protein ACFOY4_01525 [Actinomadura syzygii]|uniref:Uncharacterized protein n=1 Tax=Actinomadura syzygii TaxID=1427538 RepID=A0A5D0TS91_9ACTN|nr:hypothetical protein [Actinomadura syzygii]TYC08573.1 hypothetical protein FXF65_37400 [Actinomadura syzygii]